jgi:hypothetical protein
MVPAVSLTSQWHRGFVNKGITGSEVVPRPVTNLSSGAKGLSLPGSELEDCATSSSEGGVSRRGGYPRLGFIVTNLETPSRAVVRFYNKRGTAEQWIKEGKQAVKMTRLSCHRFRSNQVRLAVSLLAYNLGNLWRRLGSPRGIENWSLTSLQQRLVKTGGRLVKHARYYWFSWRKDI